MATFVERDPMGYDEMKTIEHAGRENQIFRYGSEWFINGYDEPYPSEAAAAKLAREQLEEAAAEEAAAERDRPIYVDGFGEWR